MTDRCTVVIPVYNGARTLAQCLETLLAGGCPARQIIVVDDGSTDETPAILERFPVRRIRLPKNLGRSAARNAGMRASDAELIAFTDADCRVVPGWYAQIQEAFLNLRLREPKLFAVHGRVRPSGGFLIAADAYEGYGDLQWGDAPEWRMNLCTANALVDRNAALMLGGFEEALRVQEDRELGLRAIREGFRIAYTPQVMVLHDPPRHGFDALLRHSWEHGSQVGLALEWRYAEVRGIRWVRQLRNPVIYALLSPLLSLAMTLGILKANLLHDARVLAYAPVIFLNKLVFRLGCAKWLLKHNIGEFPT